MKHGKQLLVAATMVAIGGLYGCTDGDDTQITLEAAPGNGSGGGVDGGTGGGDSSGNGGAVSQNCPSWTSPRSRINGVDTCQLPSTIDQDRVLTSNITWYLAGRVTVGNGNDILFRPIIAVRLRA